MHASSISWLPCKGICAHLQGQLLISLLADRKDDDEFVLQIIITLQTLLGLAPTREAVLGTSEARASPASNVLALLGQPPQDSGVQ
jgi:hypothetical protein